MNGLIINHNSFNNINNVNNGNNINIIIRNPTESYDLRLRIPRIIKVL